MKKIFLSLLLAAAYGVSANAQQGKMGAGLNLGYGTEIESVGIGAKFNWAITDHVRLSPSFNYFLENKFKTSAWEINADVHYLFNVSEKFAIYPLAGVTYSSWSAGLVSLSYFGANVGAGFGFDLSDALTLGLEAKYSTAGLTGQVVPAIYLTYNF